MGRRQAYKREPSFLEKNPEHLLHYNLFRKNARNMDSSGQYWLGREYTMRADCLLRGDYNAAMVPVRTENFIYNKVNDTIGGK